MIDSELQPDQDTGDTAPEEGSTPVRAGEVPAVRDARGSIDWSDLRERLNEVGRRLDAEETMDRASELKLLEARARALARRSATDAGGARMLLVRVSLGGSVYAVEARHIAAVVKRAQIAFLPGAAPPAVALASWRGRLLPALDVRTMLGHSAPATNEFLVIGMDSAPMALLVDQVLDIQELESADAGPVPAGLRRSGMLGGVLSDGTPVLNTEEVVRLGAPAAGNHS